MDWNAVGAVGEILGAVAVFLTLLYLATQIKQTNKMSRFETTREIMSQFNACNHLYATDAEISAVLLSQDELSFEESEQLYAFVDMYCNAWVTAQLAFEQGMVDETLYSGAVKDIEVAINRWPNMRQPLKRWFDSYPDFKDSTLFRAIEPR